MMGKQAAWNLPKHFRLQAERVHKALRLFAKANALNCNMEVHQGARRFQAQNEYRGLATLRNNKEYTTAGKFK
jgi:hypothetical protein